VKAIWLRKILDAQRADGGWDGIHVMAHLPGTGCCPDRGAVYTSGFSRGLLRIFMRRRRG
ncbi:MAG: hypothetical protein JWN63_238, partial [Candidatus Acidoferrum typicum]|nr:hypothetical protein [Candidatus Acidoferrum typicum]